MRSRLWLSICVALVWAWVAPQPAAAQDAEVADCLKTDLAPAAKVAACRAAAENGDADAQLRLGVMYDNGQGVAQDYAEAMTWFRRAAAQGNAGAQVALGVMYAGGQGVPQDYAEAMTWYRRAAAQGNAGAQVNLGVMYSKGRGVAQDHAEALVWYRRAAAQDYGLAQYNLGVMYSKGRGVAQDYTLAHMWFNLASASGYKDASEARNEMAKRMTLAQIAEAQRLAREWTQAYTVGGQVVPAGPGTAERF